jgi:hypothetical protein
MRFTKAFIFLFMSGLFMTELCYAQTKTLTKSRLARPPKSRPNKASIVCPIFDEKHYPYQGIGIKLGDPFALTYKFYASRKLAFSLDAGKTASSLYNEYYRNSFMDYMPDTLIAGESIQHLSHKVISNVFLEGKFLYQWDAEIISKGLQFYAGLGWQWRSANIKYQYLYSEASPGGGGSKTGTLTQNRYTYGPVGVLGFEYAYFSIPISAFIEIEWFSDVALDPGYHRFQGGVGLRYVF